MKRKHVAAGGAAAAAKKPAALADRGDWCQARIVEATARHSAKLRAAQQKVDQLKAGQDVEMGALKKDLADAVNAARNVALAAAVHTFACDECKKLLL